MKLTSEEEPFVDSATAAEFLGMSIDQIRRMAASGHIPSRRYGLGKRQIYRFRLSELAKAGEFAPPKKES